MSSHVAAGTHRRCPVCQALVDVDHDEALVMNEAYDKTLEMVDKRWPEIVALAFDLGKVRS